MNTPKNTARNAIVAVVATVALGSFASPSFASTAKPKAKMAAKKSHKTTKAAMATPTTKAAAMATTTTKKA